MLKLEIGLHSLVKGLKLSALLLFYFFTFLLFIFLFLVDFRKFILKYNNLHCQMDFPNSMKNAETTVKILKTTPA